MNASLATVPICAFAGCALAVAVGDVRALRIANRLVAAVAALFVVHAFNALDPGAVAAAGAVAALVLAAGFVLFHRGWLGGGDAKLLAASALWAGAAHLGTLLAVTALGGGALALALKAPIAAPLHAHWHRVAPDIAQPMPYGVAVAGGMIAVAARLLGG